MTGSLRTTLTFGFLACGIARGAVTINGTTTDCFAGRTFRPRGVEVYLFDAAKYPRITTLMKDLDGSGPLNDQESIERFDKRYAELIKLVKGTAPLARAKSDRAGSFRATIADTESVIVFGYAELEDRPFYFTHAVVAVSHRSNISVVLDFARKDNCSSARIDRRSRHLWIAEVSTIEADLCQRFDSTFMR
jgi:hypothetical protein